jgi:hypothetical protein
MNSDGLPVKFVSCDENGVRMEDTPKYALKAEEELRLNTMWHLFTRLVALSVASALVLIGIFGQGFSAEARAKMMIVIAAAGIVDIVLMLVVAHGRCIAIKALSMFALACLMVVGLYNLL